MDCADDVEKGDVPLEGVAPRSEVGEAFLGSGDDEDAKLMPVKAWLLPNRLGRGIPLLAV